MLQQLHPRCHSPAVGVLHQVQEGPCIRRDLHSAPAVAVLGPKPVKNADQESGCFSVLLLLHLAKFAGKGRWCQSRDNTDKRSLCVFMWLGVSLHKTPQEPMTRGSACYPLYEHSPNRLPKQTPKLENVWKDWHFHGGTCLEPRSISISGSNLAEYSWGVWSLVMPKATSTRHNASRQKVKPTGVKRQSSWTWEEQTPPVTSCQMSIGWQCPISFLSIWDTNLHLSYWTKLLPTQCCTNICILPRFQLAQIRWPKLKQSWQSEPLGCVVYVYVLECMALWHCIGGSHIFNIYICIM